MVERADVDLDDVRGRDIEPDDGLDRVPDQRYDDVVDPAIEPLGGAGPPRGLGDRSTFRGAFRTVHRTFKARRRTW